MQFLTVRVTFRQNSIYGGTGMIIRRATRIEYHGQRVYFFTAYSCPISYGIEEIERFEVGWEGPGDENKPNLEEM